MNANIVTKNIRSADLKVGTSYIGKVTVKDDRGIREQTIMFTVTKISFSLPRTSAPDKPYVSVKEIMTKYGAKTFGDLNSYGTIKAYGQVLGNAEPREIRLLGFERWYSTEYYLPMKLQEVIEGADLQKLNKEARKNELKRLIEHNKNNYVNLQNALFALDKQIAVYREELLQLNMED